MATVRFKSAVVAHLQCCWRRPTQYVETGAGPDCTASSSRQELRNLWAYGASQRHPTAPNPLSRSICSCRPGQNESCVAAVSRWPRPSAL